MQAAAASSALCFSQSSSSLPSQSPWMKMMMIIPPPLQNGRSLRLRIKLATALPTDNSVVDYNSSATSVFPAEACETIGGDACAADIYPEVKLTPETIATKALATTEEAVDREYMEYDNNPKTVFPAEACDDLGGEFCEPEYQKGIYK